MIKIINEGKQVGKVSYCIPEDELDTLYKILRTQEIRRSRKPEKNLITNQNEHYISLSRDLVSHPKKDPSRWGIGVILDGDKLSNKYSINPFSYTGQAFQSNIPMLRLKSIMSYDDDTYTVSFVNFTTIKINKRCYDELRDLILSQSDELNTKKRLKVLSQGAKRFGHSRIEGYVYDSQVGLPINYKNLSSQLMNYIAKETTMNETEERIWGIDREFISIKDCILGIILPEKWKEDYETPDDTTTVGYWLSQIKSFKYYVTWY